MRAAVAAPIGCVCLCLQQGDTQTRCRRGLHKGCRASLCCHMSVAPTAGFPIAAGQKEHGSGDAPRCLPCETGDRILRAVGDRGGAVGDTGFAPPVVRAKDPECQRPNLAHVESEFPFLDLLHRSRRLSRTFVRQSSMVHRAVGSACLSGCTLCRVPQVVVLLTTSAALSAPWL